MKYTNETVRRQDRLLDEKSAVEILRNGEYGFLAMQSENGGGYGLPISYVWNERNSIYLHCSPTGRKLRCIELCNKVTFSVVGKTKVIPEKFTTAYESIILECNASINLPKEEKMKALELLIEKYSPDHKEIGLAYAEKSFDRTEIIRLDVLNWSGKCKRIINY